MLKKTNETQNGKMAGVVCGVVIWDFSRVCFKFGGMHVNVYKHYSIVAGGAPV